MNFGYKINYNSRNKFAKFIRSSSLRIFPVNVTTFERFFSGQSHIWKSRCVTRKYKVITRYKNKKTDFSFDLALCASSMKIGPLLRDWGNNPKQRSYRKTKLNFFFGGIFPEGFCREDFYLESYKLTSYWGCLWFCLFARYRNHLPVVQFQIKTK